MPLLRRLVLHAQHIHWQVGLAWLERLPAWKLFLGAVLLGLLLGLPWQCARQWGSGKTPEPDVAVDSASSEATQAPDKHSPGRAQSILGMPAPSPTAPAQTSAAETPVLSITNEAPVAGTGDASTEASVQVDASAAVALHAPAPQYPAAALRGREEGTVMVRVDIDASGLPVRVGIEKSSRSRTLDRAAVDAVGQWRFKPAMAQGVAVESSLVVPISFKADAGEP